MTREPTDMEMQVASALLKTAEDNSVDLSAMEAHLMARAAIRAMREPTPDIIEAHSETCAGDADEAGPKRIREAWQAMIDSASPGAD